MGDECYVRDVGIIWEEERLNLHGSNELVVVASEGGRGRTTDSGRTLNLMFEMNQYRNITSLKFSG